MNPWTLYDELIGGIPAHITIVNYNAGQNWSLVTSSEGGTGIAKTIPMCSVPYSFTEQFEGAPLARIAKLSKSWNFVEAALGVAAIGAYYNHPRRAVECGIEHPCIKKANQNVFELYSEEIKGLKVTVIGHFPAIEQKYGTICELTVLERDPQQGDLPDPACEYILAGQDYVFMTGCTLVNKTLPRLLELSKNAKIVMVGPSTILSPIMIEHGVYGLSGMVVQDSQYCDALVRTGSSFLLFAAGEMVNYVRR